MRTLRSTTHPADARGHTKADDRYRIFVLPWPVRRSAGWRWTRDNDPDERIEAIAFDRAIREGYPPTAEQGPPLYGQYFLHPGRTA
jgi:hypothetical protein